MRRRNGAEIGLAAIIGNQKANAYHPVEAGRKSQKANAHHRYRLDGTGISLKMSITRVAEQVLAVLLVGATVSGCLSFENPPSGLEADAAPYLGMWVAEEGSPPDSLQLLIEQAPGDALIVTATDVGAGESLTLTVRLIDIDGMTVAAIEGSGPANVVDLVAVSVATDTLYVRSPDEDKIREDIINGVLAGSIITEPYDPSEGHVDVTASGGELSSYIVANPDLFPTELVGVMVRPTAPPTATSVAANMEGPRPAPSRDDRRWTPLLLLVVVVVLAAGVIGVAVSSRGRPARL